MKKTLAMTALAAALAAPFAHAERGDIVVRLRATYVHPEESSSLGQTTNKTYNTPGLANVLYGNDNAKLIPDSNTIGELDISYYLTHNLAAELILAAGTDHDVKVSGKGGILTTHRLGDVNMLPPVLSLQWHFSPEKKFDPYVGIGVAWIHMFDDELEAHTVLGTLPIHVEEDMFGPSFQFGMDWNLPNRWLVNVDVKKVLFGTDVWLDTQGAAGLPGGFKKIDGLDIDPWVVSFGIGKKF